jgi:hypothetical protein
MRSPKVVCALQRAALIFLCESRNLAAALKGLNKARERALEREREEKRVFAAALLNIPLSGAINSYLGGVFLQPR